MDCERCTEDLTAYLDGELSETKASDVKAHLVLCESCREEFRSLELSARFVETHANELQIRPETWISVRARLSTLEIPSPAPGPFQWLISNPWWVAATTALATVALTLGVWGYMRHQETQRDLMQYMTRYVTAREAQEQVRQVPVNGSRSLATESGVFHPEHMDNPFVTVNSIPDINPFRSEDQ